MACIVSRSGEATRTIVVRYRPTKCLIAAHRFLSISIIDYIPVNEDRIDTIYIYVTLLCLRSIAMTVNKLTIN